MGGKGAERQVWEGRWGNSAGGWLVFPTSPWWCPGVVKGGSNRCDLGGLGCAGTTHLSRAQFPRCHPSASPEKPPPPRACRPCWARRPVPAPTSCPSRGPGTGRTGTGPSPCSALAWPRCPGVSAHPCPCRTGASGPWRSLSVEDISAPGLPRTVGRVVEVFPDGTSQLELQRPPHGSFGFLLTSGHGRPDTGTVGLCKKDKKSPFWGG